MAGPGWAGSDWGFAGCIELNHLLGRIYLPLCWALRQAAGNFMQWARESRTLDGRSRLASPRLAAAQLDYLTRFEHAAKLFSFYRLGLLIFFSSFFLAFTLTPSTWLLLAVSCEKGFEWKDNGECLALGKLSSRAIETNIFELQLNCRPGQAKPSPVQPNHSILRHLSVLFSFLYSHLFGRLFSSLFSRLFLFLWLQPTGRAAERSAIIVQYIFSITLKERIENESFDGSINVVFAFLASKKIKNKKKRVNR